MLAHRIAAQGKAVHEGWLTRLPTKCRADAVPIRPPDRQSQAMEGLVIPNFDRPASGLVESVGAKSFLLGEGPTRLAARSANTSATAIRATDIGPTAARG